MVRPLLPRVIACVLALVVGFAAPTSALAHGYAHREANHHRLEHDAAAGAAADHRTSGDHDAQPAPTPSASRALTDDTNAVAAHGPAVAPAGGHSDHAHAELSAAVSAKPGVLLALPPAARISIAVTAVRVDSAALLLTSAPPRAGPGNAPPPEPRGPPLG